MKKLKKWKTFNESTHFDTNNINFVNVYVHDQHIDADITIETMNIDEPIGISFKQIGLNEPIITLSEDSIKYKDELEKLGIGFELHYIIGPSEIISDITNYVYNDIKK
jgi:hypothetical protein